MAQIIWPFPPSMFPAISVILGFSTKYKKSIFNNRKHRLHLWNTMYLHSIVYLVNSCSLLLWIPAENRTKLNKLTLFEPLNQVEQNTANIQTALDLFSSNSSMIGTFVMKELKHNMFLCTYSLFTWFHLLYWLIVQVSVIVKAQYFYSFNNNSQSKQNQKISTHHSWDIY